MIGAFMTLANARANALAVAALDVRDGNHLLELGCGPGRALEAMLRVAPSVRVTGIDWSELMLAQASSRNRTALEAGHLALIRGDFSNLPLTDESVDFVLAVNVVYFMHNPEAAREAHRVLRPGGRIVLYATHGSVMKHWSFAGPDTHRLFDEQELTVLLADAGFESGRIEVAEVDAGFGVKGLLAIATKAPD